MEINEISKIEEIMEEVIQEAFNRVGVTDSFACYIDIPENEIRMEVFTESGTKQAWIDIPKRESFIVTVVAMVLFGKYCRQEGIDVK